MNGDDPSRPPDLYRMNLFTLEPGHEILFQNQNRLAWLVGRQVTSPDRAFDGPGTAFGQLGCLFDADMVRADHCCIPP